jgi:hypothetical protein
MSTSLTVECDFRIERGPRGRQTIDDTPPHAQPAERGRVPRVARLLALAHRFDGLLKSGAVKDYTELARLGHVTRARISQVMSLLYLAPNLQETVLFLPRTLRGRDPIQLRHLLPIAACPDWRKQRRLWAELVRFRGEAGAGDKATGSS